MPDFLRKLIPVFIRRDLCDLPPWPRHQYENVATRLKIHARGESPQSGCTCMHVYYGVQKVQQGAPYISSNTTPLAAKILKNHGKLPLLKRPVPRSKRYLRPGYVTGTLAWGRGWMTMYLCSFVCQHHQIAQAGLEGCMGLLLSQELTLCSGCVRPDNSHHGRC